MNEIQFRVLAISETGVSPTLYAVSFVPTEELLASTFEVSMTRAYMEQVGLRVGDVFEMRKVMTGE